MPPPTIYYIRHGETDWNVVGRLQGRHDVPLNARGRTQAEHCGNILRDLFARSGRNAADFDYVSSPLGRAREPMALMRPPLGLPLDGRSLPKSLSVNGKASRLHSCITVILSALPPASTTNGILRHPAGKVTQPSPGEWVTGT